MIKSKIYLLLVTFLFITMHSTFAQKAKFKNESCSVQKTRLPTHYVDPAHRTYDLFAKGNYSENVESHGKKIYGWTLDQENPNLKGVVSMYGFSISTPRKTSTKKTTKNKEGKVTDSWTEYKYSATAVGKTTLYVYGEDNPFKYDKDGDDEKKKSKAEIAKEEEAARAKKELEANPFLTADDIDDAVEAGESDEGEDSGFEGEELQLVSRVSLDLKSSVETNYNKSATKAYKEYTEKHRPELYNFKDAYPNKAYKNAVQTLNQMYGYTPVKKRVTLKAMRTEKHADYKNWSNACQATETLFSAFKYNSPIVDNQAKFDPIINYFEDFVNSLSDSDRKTRSMKKAAFHNLTNILFYLDRHDELIAVCDKNMSSKVLDNQAKKMLKKSKKLHAFLEFHHMDTCHIDMSSDSDDEDDIETEEADEDDEDEDDDEN